MPRQAPPLFLGIDLGLSALKACIIDAQGIVCAEAQAPLVSRHPQPGWCEQSAPAWRSAMMRLTAQTWRKVAGKGSQLGGLSLTAGAHSAVLTDGRGRALAPVMMWNDQRAAAEADMLRRHEASFVRRALNRPSATWTAAHLLWRARHTPDILRKAERLYWAKDWLRAQFTAQWHTDFSDAIGGLLADRRRQAWDAGLVAAARWRMGNLPPIAAPLAQLGEILPAAARASGLPSGAPVFLGANDTSVELLTANACAPGAVTIKLASAGVVSVCQAAARPKPPISLYPHLCAGLYYHAAGTNACTGALVWAQRALGFASLAALEHAAASSPPGANGVSFYPYLQGERAPLWTPHARAAWTGLTHISTRADMARAAWEGVTFALAENWATMRRRLRIAETRASLLGGGARSRFWGQMLADVTGLRLQVPRAASAAYGAALVAATASGCWRNLQEAASANFRLAHELRPSSARHRLYRPLLRRFLAQRARLLEAQQQRR